MIGKKYDIEITPGISPLFTLIGPKRRERL
jgi:hypothetical protein